MAATRQPTLEDTFKFRAVTDARLSPDAQLVAFVSGETAIHDTPLPHSNLWVVSIDGGEPRRFTTGPTSDVAPQWSPDGGTLAFLSDRDTTGRYQVHMIHRDFGESVRLTDMEAEIYVNRGMRPILWSPGGTKIAFLARDPETAEEKRRREEQDDFTEFEQHPKYLRLHTVEIDTGVVECISPDSLQIWEFAWSPDGSEIAAMTSDLPTETDWYLNRLDVFSSKDSGSVRTLYDTHRSAAQPQWSPDGRQIAFISCRWSDKGQVNGSVFVVPAESGVEARELTPGHPISYGWIEWSEDGSSLMVAGQDGGESCVVEIDLESGERSEVWRSAMSLADTNFPQFSAVGDRIALILESYAEPPDVWLGSRSDGGIDLQRLTWMNPQTDDLELGTAESIWWKGADGWDVQGFLIRPPGVGSQGKLPTIMYVHGGPMGAHLNLCHAGAQRVLPVQLAAQGYAVFLPNPRGSSGRGNDFAEAVLGDTGGKDWEDLERGLDHLIERGIADPDRLGITGGSYGGFMTTWAVTQTDRFKAAVAVASHPEWRSFHGVSGIRHFDVFFQSQVDPYDNDGSYRQRSGLSHVRNVKTPTLLLHGEVDQVCPVDQAYQYYRALKELDIETDLVVYPREPHGMKERVHILDSHRRTVEWLTERV